jgi:hypothetical protein
VRLAGGICQGQIRGFVGGITCGPPRRAGHLFGMRASGSGWCGPGSRGGAVRHGDEARRGGEVEEEQCAAAVAPVGEVKGMQRYAGLDGPS